MRQIASISNRDNADRFADHLRSIGIPCTVDATDEGFRVWVHDDDKVPAAKAELPDFLANPHHERYRDAAKRAVQAARKIVNQNQTVNLSERWDRVSSQPSIVTFFLIGMMIIFTVLIGFMSKENNQRLDRFYFTDDGTINPILHGEVWRLISPIFLHGDPMHLLFNIIMLYQLGQLIESRLESFKFLGMVLTIAALSNAAEFYFGAHQRFGGMSGVNYGLFGYCWIRGRIDPLSGFALQPQAVNMMLIWFVLCVIGVISNVANWVHGVGLATGIVIAYGGTLVKSIRRQR